MEGIEERKQEQEQVRSRHLDWGNCLNVRDLGGLPTQDAGSTRFGRILRADNLAHLTPESQEALVEYGVSTIIDLRSPTEMEMYRNPFALGAPDAGRHPHYFALPLLDEADLEGRNALNSMSTTAENYIYILDRYWQRIAAILRVVAGAPDTGAVLIHCHAGKDRTGLVSALILSVAGVPRETVAEDYALSNERLRPLYERLLTASNNDPKKKVDLDYWLKTNAGTMLVALAHLDKQYGSVEAYLRVSGMKGDEIARLRGRLRDTGSR